MSDVLRSEIVPLLGIPMSITVNHGPQTVTFRYCHSRPSFWSITSAPEVVCRFEEILDVAETSYRRGRTLHIITTRGRAQMTNSWDNFEPMHTALGKIASRNPSAPLHTHPRFLFLALPLAVTAAVIWIVIFMGWIG